MTLDVAEQNCLKKFFLTPNWENEPNIGFFGFIEKLVIDFYWICSIMKVYIICCVPSQIPYLGKILLLRYGPKHSQPIRLQDFKIKWICEIAWFYACWCKFKKTKSWSNMFWFGMVKNGFGQFAHDTLKLTASQDAQIE